ncbi:MAG: hypothetical protein ISEC1_P0441 [Thiomicrorhabdus sp.]|nr:MAG: hypothetical protein ISEC1_P0441 [Thiomicrorhabdus sp.]
MKKLLLSTMAVTAFSLPFSASAASEDLKDLGVAINYGLFSGATLELSYPVGNDLHVRGALSAGMGLSETSTGSATEPTYAVEASGGIHRLALDYRPFNGGFFLSGGYAINSYAIDISSTITSAVTVGEVNYSTANATLAGQLSWNNAPTLSLGWGHSPAEGWGGLFEVGAIFTGAPEVSLTGTGTLDGLDVSNDASVLAALNDEETKIKDEVANFDFLPIIQVGVTYRF